MYWCVVADLNVKDVLLLLIFFFFFMKMVFFCFCFGLVTKLYHVYKNC